MHFLNDRCSKFCESARLGFYLSLTSFNNGSTFRFWAVINVKTILHLLQSLVLNSELGSSSANQECTLTFETQHTHIQFKIYLWLEHVLNFHIHTPNSTVLKFKFIFRMNQKTTLKIYNCFLYVFYNHDYMCNVPLRSTLQLQVKPRTAKLYIYNMIFLGWCCSHVTFSYSAAFINVILNEFWDRR